MLRLGWVTLNAPDAMLELESEATAWLVVSRDRTDRLAPMPEYTVPISSMYSMSSEETEVGC